MTTRVQFAVGDRVTWAHPAQEPGFTTTVREPDHHGVVVYYHHSEHKPRQPRVRWNSGWGYHVNAARLRVLTAEEAAQYPTPELVAVDQPLGRRATV